MIAKPSFRVFPSGNLNRYYIPKAGRVVGLDQMRKLMDHEVINNEAGPLHYAPVEIQVAARGAGAPADFQVGNQDAIENHAHRRTKVLGA